MRPRLFYDFGAARRVLAVEKGTVLSPPQELPTPQATPVCGMQALFNRFPSNIACLSSPISVHNVKGYGFTVTLARPGHSRVLAREGDFSNENALVRIVSVNEAVTTPDIVPPDSTEVFVVFERSVTS